MARPEETKQAKRPYQPPRLERVRIVARDAVLLNESQNSFEEQLQKMLEESGN